MMEILRYVSENSFLVSLFCGLIVVQVRQHFTVKKHTEELEQLQKAHDENKKLIENIIRMEENIKYIMMILDKLEKKI